MSHRGDARRSAQKLLGARGVKLRVAAGSIIALGLGAWLTPPAVPTALSAPQEHAAPLLEEQVQLREVPRPFRGVQEVADRVRRFAVAIPEPERARVAVLNDFSAANGTWEGVGFGVIVTETLVLTHANAVGGRESIPVATVDGLREMRVTAYEPATGLILLRSTTAIGPPAPIAAEAPAAGALAVAAASWQGRDIAVPLFVTSVTADRYTITATVSRTLQTMPLYTPEGELLAIVSGDGPGWQAFPAGPAVQRLLARASKDERLASFGVGLQELTPLLQQAFGEGGVLISDTVEGGPADLAGLQVGDVLVRIGEADVTTVDTAVRIVNAATVGTATTLEVRRIGRVRKVEVVPALAYQVSWLARRERPSVSALDARDAFATGLLDASGIPPDARVLTVNGRVVSSRAEVDRELRRPGPPLRVLVHDGDRQFFAAIAPRR